MKSPTPDKQPEPKALHTTMAKQGVKGVAAHDMRAEAVVQRQVTDWANQQASPFASMQAPVIQRRELNLGSHGTIEIGDFHNGLAPDAPVYGGNKAVGAFGNAASSMEVLVTPNHPAGGSPNALNDVFDHIPTVGNYRLPANAGRPKNGSTLYIKGHLLNDNLGGPGSQQNLYPITHQANVDHSSLVEEPLKDWVNNQRGVAWYKVEVTGGNVGDIAQDTGVVDAGGTQMHHVNANFQLSIEVLKNDDQVQQVANNKIITSVWGNTNNAGQLNFPANPKRVSVLDAEVKLPPRAVSKKEWDETLLKTAAELAEASKLPLEAWLQTIKGIGPGGAALVAGIKSADTKATKGTLTRARGLLKAYLEHWAEVEAAAKAAIATAVDTGTAAADVPDASDIAVVAVEIQTATHVIDEIDMLIESFAALSLDDGSGHGSSAAALPLPSSSSGVPARKNPRKQANPQRSLPEGTRGTLVFDQQVGDFVPFVMSYKDARVAKYREPVAAGVHSEAIRLQILAGTRDILLVNIYNEFDSDEEGIAFYIALFNEE